MKPSVLVSYSHDSPEHAARVRRLAEDLRERGLDARIDQFLPELGPEEGWVTWMQREVEECQWVVMVCTEAYRRRLEKKEQPGKGLGATFEGHVLMQMLSEGASRRGKLVPVVFGTDDPERVITLPLRSFRHFRIPEEIESLVRGLGSPSEAALVGPRAGNRALVPTPSSGRGGRRRTWAIGLSVLLALAAVGVVALKTRFFSGSESWPKLVTIRGDGSNQDCRDPAGCAGGAFRISATEVTQGEWQSIMHKNPSPETFGIDPRYPVIDVTWSEALEFTNALSEVRKTRPCYRRSPEGWYVTSPACTGYRLPTATEWERIGSQPQARNSCQDGNLADRTFFHKRPKLVEQLQQEIPNFLPVECSDDYDGLAPVGSFRPNRQGIFDLEGNAAEWVTSSSEDGRLLPAVRGTAFLGPGRNSDGYRKDQPLQPDGRYWIGLRLARNAI